MDDEEPDDDQGREINATEVNDVLQKELEGLSREIETSGEQAVDENFDADEAGKLEEACGILAGASEALQTVRDARRSLNLRKKKATTYSRRTSSLVSTTKGTSKGQAQPKSIAERKKTSKCAVCGQLGHWKGDPECPGQKGSRQVQVAEGYDEEDPTVRDTFISERIKSGVDKLLARLRAL